MPVDPSYGERLARQVSDLFAAAELSLLRRIARTLAAGIDAPTWATDRLTQLDLLRARMARETTELTEQATGTLQHVIATAWTRGQSLAVADLDGLDLDVRLPPARMAGIERLAAETLTVIAPVGQRMLRSALDIYTQVIAESSSVVLLGSGTRVDAAQHALDRLTTKGVTSFTDTAGRQWSAPTYVEMATRTGAGRAAVQGHVDQLQANGLDLVMVSDSPRECAACRPWEGKVLSIGGSVAGAIEVDNLVGEGTVTVRVAGTLDEARAAGLQHPNCRHSVSAYLPGASRPATNTRDTETRYAEEQQQRYLERGIRHWKQRAATALTPEAEKRANVKVREWQARQRAHLAATDGLTRKSQREQISRAR
ncbi:phage minor capsid protein [Ornithinimicrobium sufpigmenti]|uniref:phage minor capsid protein n=1 Tax=Ornithinimicrobium sufpigmenti TaxID=2508882 RepID=UPI0010359E88|nr:MULTISPECIES: phage minor capsid protein [unclassified Ornithinimicrobium]